MDKMQLAILTGIIVFFGMIIIYTIMGKLNLNRSKNEANKVLEDAESQADSIVREATLKAKTESYEIKLEAERDSKAQLDLIQKSQSKLDRRADNLDFRDANIKEKEKSLQRKEGELDQKKSVLDKMELELNQHLDVQVQELERITSLPVEKAKEELMDIVEKRMEQETLAYIKEQEEAAQQKADQMATNIISLAISRMAQDVVTQNTAAIVVLPNEDMKGRIIGREGRNIRAFENVTGVDLIIDDTPEIITVSSFDPIRREVARMSLEKLVQDGRIQPGRIEEVVSKTKNDLHNDIQKVGQDALFDLGISKVSKEMTNVLGRLKYRYSYGQNALRHSIEVAHLTGIMAAELGLNQKLARRAGLFHDIGKGLDFEMEGSHVELGVRLARKSKEHPVVVNAIASHHGDTAPTSVISVLVQAADAISAARPGARYESLENYIQRLEDLEAIAMSKEGVHRSFAISAGRELRVMVIPNEIDDLQTTKLAREIKDEIEEQMTYPGQIKVTVIRELRAQELAK